MRKRSLSFISLVLLTSCTIYGVTDDYRKLSTQQQQQVVPLRSFTNTDSETVHKINGKQLREEIQKHPKALVYIFSNGCKAAYCYPMSTYEKFAKENGYRLFLVMEGFGNQRNNKTALGGIYSPTLRH